MNMQVVKTLLKTAGWLIIGALAMKMGMGAPQAHMPKEHMRPSANGKAVGIMTMKVVVTAYSVDRRQCGKTDGITSTGINGKKIRGVAVDPTLIPYGSRLIIPGVDEELRADDTGGAMRQDWRQNGIGHIDLRFTGKDAKKRALAWGVKTLEVQVILPVS